MSTLLLSTESTPGSATWASSAGSALAPNIFGFNGGGGTISAAESYSIWCTTGANQVNVGVGQPAFAGQTYYFYFGQKTAAANVVVTFPAALNSAGNTIVTMNDQNDSFVATAVVALISGINITYRWIITTNNGCTLS